MSEWRQEKGRETIVLALQSAACVLFLLVVLGGRALEPGGKFQLWNLCNYVGEFWAGGFRIMGSPTEENE